jgi:hypothetical protein
MARCQRDARKRIQSGHFSSSLDLGAWLGKWREGKGSLEQPEILTPPVVDRVIFRYYSQKVILIIICSVRSVDCLLHHPPLSPPLFSFFALHEVLLDIISFYRISFLLHLLRISSLINDLAPQPDSNNTR